MRLLPLLLLATLAGCAAQSEELLPIPASVRGASRVDAVEVKIRATAAAAVAALDQKAATSGASTDAPAAGQPFRQLLADSVDKAARDRGLRSGRALKLIVEVDEIEVAETAAALFGRSDRLAGSVFVADAATGEPLGQLYVDVVNTNAGLSGLALRGGGVREALAREFAAHVARALGGRRRKP